MEETSQKWELEWGGKCLFSYGTKHSKGTIILYKQGLDVEVMQTKSDIEGRYIIIRANIQGESFIIVNVYAPTKVTGKDIFFKKLMTELQNVNVTINDRLILGGDWNTIQDIKIDKKGGNKNFSSTLPKMFSELMSNYNLIDIWRILNPNTDRFTYRQKTPLIQTRLDYFLISNNIQDLIVKTDILPSIRSDHSAIIIQVKHLPDHLRGNGHWKFNTSLIRDEAYIEKLKQQIKVWKRDYSAMEDKRVVWDLIKYEIRKFTMSFSSQKKRDKNNNIKQLEVELNKVNKDLASYPSNALQLRYDTIAHQLKQYEDDKVKGEIIRSKIQWAEEGERSTKYFLGMEKHNQSKKHIRKIEIDKVIITDPQKIQHHQKKYYEDLYKSKQDIDYTIPDKFFN